MKDEGGRGGAGVVSDNCGCESEKERLERAGEREREQGREAGMLSVFVCFPPVSS